MPFKTVVKNLFGQKPESRPAVPANLLDLYRLKRDHQLLRVRVDGLNGDYQSLLLQIDTRLGQLILDELFPRPAAHYNLEGRRLVVSSREGSMPVRFESKILGIHTHLDDDSEEIVLAMPAEIESMQRRATFRVPVDDFTLIQASLHAPQSDKLEVRALDLSIDGIRLELPGHHETLAGALASVFLRLGSEPLMHCHLKVCNLRTRGKKDNGATVVGGQFVELNAPQRQSLERFVLRTQQDMRQRQLAEREA